MKEIGPSTYEKERKVIIPNNLPGNIAPAAMVAFGRFSMSPMALAKKKSRLTLEYEVQP